jgi:hypothetical protein
VNAPDYSGGSIINLVATIEGNLAGSTPGTPLVDRLVPDARSYLVVLFDGLGDSQLAHPDADPLRASRVGAIDTVFPCTTTTALASIVTGMTPAEHGLLGYEMWLPEAGGPLNTIHWTPVGGGDVVDVDFDSFLPSPNLWERLAATGVEPVTVQPAAFAGSPLSRVLYRGCRYEAVDSYDEWLDAALSLVAEPGRLVFAYLGAVDVAAHLRGQASEEYAGALRLAGALWERLVATTPDGTAVIGTADHGHVDAGDKVRLDTTLEEAGRTFGGGRVMFAMNDVAGYADGLPAQWVGGTALTSLFGPGNRHPAFEGRAPAGAFFADDGVRLLHRHSDKRLVGVHGALSDAERRVPVLVGP